MTLPSNHIYPLINDFKEEGDLVKYVRDLVFSMQQRDEQIVQGINGDIRGSAFQQRENWTPVLKGTSAAGTFTYTHQTGWVLRQGLLVDCWFDILWTAQSSATGNLYIELPYKVAITANKPFVGCLQTATLNYGAGQSVLNINAITNTYRGEIWSSGSTTATANIAVAAAGQLIGHIRYLGVSDE